MNRYLVDTYHEFNNFTSRRNQHFHYFNFDCNCKLLAQARHLVWLNGDHLFQSMPTTPSHSVTLERSKFY